MKYVIAAPELTRPTVETLHEQVKIRFNKVEKLVARLKFPNVVVRISVRKEGRNFCLTLEAQLDFANKDFIVKEKGADLRRLVALASKTLKTEILRYKDIQRTEQLKNLKFQKNHLLKNS